MSGYCRGTLYTEFVEYFRNRRSDFMKHSLFLAFILGATVAVADVSSVCIGVDGFYKNGCWTPVVLESNADDTPVSIHTVDSDGTPTTFHGSGKTIYVKLGRATAPLTVEVGDVKKTLKPLGNPTKQKAEEKFRFSEPIPTDRPIYLVVGQDDIGLQAAIAELSLPENRRPLLVKVVSFAALPDRWFGYDAIDKVVLTTTEPTQFKGLTADSPQIKALDGWVKLGGHLFFCAGKDSGPFLEPENGPLRPFLPGKFNRMTELRKGTPLEVFIGSKRPIFMNGTAEAPFLRIPHFTEPRGIPFVVDGDLPLVLRCAHGFGTIVYFGGDLSGKPLGNWRDRTQLVRSILQWNEERKSVGTASPSLIQLGYSDLSGQIRSSLDKFDGVAIVPFSIILILLAVYLLVVGLGDWFLVHKVFKRPILTWFTFPLWIVLFSGLAYWLAASGRPNRVMINKLDVIDIDDGTMRYSYWTNLYSPHDDYYSLEMTSRPWFKSEDNGSIFAWNGLSGSGLGGMDPKTVSPTVWRSGSTHFADTPAQLGDVPVQVRSTKSFFGQSWNTQEGQGNKGTSLTDEEGVPVGTLVNPFEATLEDCLLIYGRWIQKLGTLKPKETIEIGIRTDRMQLREVLIPKGSLGLTNRKLASYNAQSNDLLYIVQVMTLFHAAGDFEAVGLNNAFQRLLDMSHLLTVDRAILIGSSTLVDGESEWGRHTIIVRQSIPVTLTEKSPRIRRSDRQEYKRDRLEDIDRTIQGSSQDSPF